MRMDQNARASLSFCQPPETLPDKQLFTTTSTVTIVQVAQYPVYTRTKMYGEEENALQAVSPNPYHGY